MRLCELKCKEVINICDGQKIGHITDMEFDLCKGCISKIIVPGPCKSFGWFGRELEYIIPVRCVRQIGEDVVLVECILEECIHKD
ncbi:MAG: YlmC/YmxH family sporulation protein [Lachnospiraceae bacterium]|jgi:sporulation protein, ylmC/ymxH family|nr:YlmC/YmxH family sporulation protein [Lachnoclostridium sp.]MDD7521554.1 YlmC/YmxH family sporulation protein [Lachnoclostridium sp.]MDY2599507.1 YlmC/YmxH family sporulation protein [Lachnospiraceae bacterium]